MLEKYDDPLTLEEGLMGILDCMDLLLKRIETLEYVVYSRELDYT